MGQALKVGCKAAVVSPKGSEHSEGYRGCRADKATTVKKPLGNSTRPLSLRIRRASSAARKSLVSGYTDSVLAFRDSVFLGERCRKQLEILQDVSKAREGLLHICQTILSLRTVGGQFAQRMH
jgi:hypothetical protein